METNQVETNQTEMNQVRTKQLRPIHGIIVFILVIAAMIFVAAPIQYRWGMYGVALTEVMILLLAIIPPIILRQDLRGIFPFQKPTGRQTLGTIILWISSYLGIVLVTLILTYLFPKAITQLNDGMLDVFTSVPGIITFLIVAVMPAICEEALHRGFILRTFSGLKNKWTIIIIMGIIFGIFHLDPFRFLLTALLGVSLSYLMVETHNMLYPMLFHFIHNGLTVFIAIFAQSLNTGQAQASAMEPKMMQAAIGAYFIIGSVIPLLLKLASHLIKPKKRAAEDDLMLAEEDVQVKEELKRAERAGRNKAWLITVLCTVVMFVIGIVIIIVSQGLL